MLKQLRARRLEGLDSNTSTSLGQYATIEAPSKEADLLSDVLIWPVVALGSVCFQVFLLHPPGSGQMNTVFRLRRQRLPSLDAFYPNPLSYGTGHRDAGLDWIDEPLCA
ncbi:hypothetical protein [Bosea caraganae]|uniref:hypothetical protein n=1 Tax=Bosea caraganae TaxID=2763117 RepID=UPI0011C035F3|nr:hypothetical protein [Bosea caraganae]